MDSPLALPIDALLEPSSPLRPPAGRGRRIGTSRQDRDLVGYRIGSGPLHVSLIAGCHADEPVGPAMLDRLAAGLCRLPPEAPLLSQLTWFIVPHANPDGEARNDRWTRPAFGAAGGRAPGRRHRDPFPATVDLGLYLRHVVRELPGDDIEFGFPRAGSDTGARPENLAMARFLRPGAPFVLHASFHGMDFAAGPWFLLELAWAERTVALRDRLRTRVRELGYRLHDIDRRGEKGFHRIDEGFTSRPDSRAMAAHFEALGDPATAALFRPSSMELVRSLGGDPLTLVSEMPLFLLPPEHYAGDDVVRPALVAELQRLAATESPEAVGAAARAQGARAMPIVDQMRLQLEYLQAGLDAVWIAEPIAKSLIGRWH